MENTNKDTAEIQSHHLYSPPFFIFTALKMQGGSICHTTLKPCRTQPDKAEFPNVNSHWRGFTFHSQRFCDFSSFTCDFSVVFHPAGAAGGPRVFNITNQCTLLELRVFHWDQDGRKLHFREFWHSSPSASWQINQGDLQGSDCLKCQLCCHQMVTKWGQIPAVT